MQTGIHVADKAHPNGDNEEITLRGAVYPCSLTCAVKDANKYVAYFNLLSSDPERVWSPEEIQLASRLTYILSGMLHTRRAAEHAESTTRTLTDVMDNMNSYVLAVVQDSGEIVFASKIFEQYYGKLVGKRKVTFSARLGVSFLLTRKECFLEEIIIPRSWTNGSMCRKSS